MSPMTPIAVAIVNHNTRDHLRECLATVQLEAPPEVVVVDNASWDGSAEMVRAQYPSVTLRANKKNLGYGAAANQAFVSCTAQHVLLLNGDTLLQPGALAALSGYLARHRRAAIVGHVWWNRMGRCKPRAIHFQRRSTPSSRTARR